MNAATAFDPGVFNASVVYALPEIFLGLAACIILMLDLVLEERHRTWTGVLSVISLVIAAILVVLHPCPTRSSRSVGCSNSIAWRRS